MDPERVDGNVLEGQPVFADRQSRLDVHVVGMFLG
jgi:hypothetical protein